MRIVLIGIGILSLILGIIGIFLPILPTAPFLLLSAACFSRSSRRMHRRLLLMPYAGKVIDDYEQGRGVSRKAKTSALLMLWGGMTTSAILVAPPWWVLAIMGATAIIASVIIVRLPKAVEPAYKPLVVDDAETTGQGK